MANANRRRSTVPVDTASPATVPPPGDETAAALQSIADEAASANTARSYNSALSYIGNWHSQRYGVPLEFPVPEHTVLTFLTDHVSSSVKVGNRMQQRTTMPAAVLRALIKSGARVSASDLSAATVYQRLAALSKWHTLLSIKLGRPLPNPFHANQVKAALANARRANAKRDLTTNKKQPLDAEALAKLLATCDDSLRGVRDRAILCFAFASGGRRRSEVTAADMKHLKKTRGGNYEYNLILTKTNQSGEHRDDRCKPVNGMAARALSAWLSMANIRSGRIFRSIGPAGKLSQSLSDSAVFSMVKQRAKAANLNAADFSPHSLRSGFVTESVRRNVPMVEAMQMTGHVTTRQFAAYYRSSASVAAANLLDTKDQET
jgi:integrase